MSAYGFFNQYLEDALFEILTSADDTILQSDWERFRNEIGEPDGTLDQRAKLADLIVERLAGPRHVGELCKFIGRRTGIDVMPDDEEKRYVLSVSALRNLIVHNDGNPNSRFLRKISGLGFDFELRPDGRVHINEKWLTQNAKFLDRIIFRFDAAVIKRLGVAAQDRRLVFWKRSFAE